VRTHDAEARMHEALLRYARQVWRREDPAAAAARLAMSVLVKRACSGATALTRSIERRLLWLGDTGPAQAAQPGLPFENEAADDEPAATLAAPGLDDRTDERQQLDAILSLARRAAGDESKVRVLRRLLRRSDEPAIVFTEYRDTLAHLAAELPASATLLHGGLTPLERREALEAFTGGRAQLLLATDAASEGLNLHHRCRRVVNMELPWTPLRLEQRVGRVDRIGQRARVHALHLVAGGTAEEHTVARLLLREARVRQALERTPAPHLDEDTIARAVLAPATEPAASASTSDPHDHEAHRANIGLPDLRGAAQEEARRLAVARRLGDAPAARGDAGRPAITVLRRHPPAGPPRCYWAFRVPSLDASGQPLWSALVGVEAVHTRAPSRGSRTLRLTIAANAAFAERAAQGVRVDILDAAARAVARSAAVAIGRERDIADDLRHHRARLAALQPGLFDRRAERVRAAQASVLDEALEDCRCRMQALGGLDAPTSGTYDLVFAALIE
jgi:hypothetical protein